MIDVQPSNLGGPFCNLRCDIQRFLSWTRHCAFLFWEVSRWKSCDLGDKRVVFFWEVKKNSGRGNCPGGGGASFWTDCALDFAILQWLKYIYCRELKRQGASVWINTVSVNHKSLRTRCLGWWQFEIWDLIRFWSLPTYLEICTFAPSFPRGLVLEDQPPTKFRWNNFSTQDAELMLTNFISLFVSWRAWLQFSKLSRSGTGPRSQ